MFSLMKYGQFILLVRQICRTAGRDLGLKTMYAVEISLISVAIVSIGFISEAILCVEYMQGKRLALVKADPAISALFALFSIMKCKFIFLKNSSLYCPMRVYDRIAIGNTHSTSIFHRFFSVFTMGQMAILAASMERGTPCLHT